MSFAALIVAHTLNSLSPTSTGTAAEVGSDKPPGDSLKVHIPDCRNPWRDSNKPITTEWIMFPSKLEANEPGWLVRGTQCACEVHEAYIDTATGELTLVALNKEALSPEGSYQNRRIVFSLSSSEIAADSALKNLVSHLRDENPPEDPLYFKFQIVSAEPLHGSITDQGLQISGIQLVSQSEYKSFLKQK